MLSHSNVLWLATGLSLVAGGLRAEDFRAESDQVLITVEATARGRPVSAVSRSLEWSLTVFDDRRAHLRLSIPLGSFSGRDEIVAVLRRAAGGSEDAALEMEGEIEDGRFTGELTLNGSTRRLSVPVTLVRAGDGMIAHTRFALDLREYGLALPPLDGAATLELAARLQSSPRAVFSAGWRRT
jgi:hypothetical protein